MTKKKSYCNQSSEIVHMQLTIMFQVPFAHIDKSVHSAVCWENIYGEIIYVDQNISPHTGNGFSS